MKILKYLFFLILIVLAGAAAYIAIINGDYEQEKSITLKAPENLVYKEVDNLKNWQNWAKARSPQKSLDISFTKKTQGQGAFLTWREENGPTDGRLENVSTMHFSSIIQKAYIEKRIGRTHYDIKWNFDNQNDTITTITLHLNAKQNFWAKAKGLIDDTSPGEGLDTLMTSRLRHIRKRVLKKMRVYSIHVDGVMKAPSKDYIYVSRATKNTPQSIAKTRQGGLKKLKDYTSRHNIEINGAPLVVYNSIDHSHGNVIISTGLPIRSSDNKPDDSHIFIGTLPKQKVIKTTLKGDYKNIPKVWEAVKTYMKNNDLKQKDDSHPYEVFERSFDDSKNPADWITELYVPVSKNNENYKLPQDLGISS